VVARSFALKRYEPRSDDRWQGHYERFKGLLHQTSTKPLS